MRWRRCRTTSSSTSPATPHSKRPISKTRLRQRGVTTLIMCGVVTYACVLATAFAGFDKGFDVVLASDATGSWSDELGEARGRNRRSADGTVGIERRDRVRGRRKARGSGIDGTMTMAYDATFRNHVMAGHAGSADSRVPDDHSHFTPLSLPDILHQPLARRSGRCRTDCCAKLSNSPTIIIRSTAS